MSLKKMEEPIGESSSIKPEHDVSAVSVQSRLLPFWREIPRAWFIQFEAVVDPLKTSDDQKFRYVLQQLQTTDLQHITDILYNPPPTDKYDAVKRRLLTVYDKSDVKNFQKSAPPSLSEVSTMAAGVLYTYPENFRAYKALIAAQYSGADVKVAPNFVFGETNKSAEFLKKFPAGKVPAYESADGKVLLTESNAIAYYVSSTALRGADAATQARVWQWASWADSELLPASCAWVFPYLGIMQFNKQNVERAKQDLLAALKVLDAHLLTRTFLVTERVTLA